MNPPALSEMSSAKDKITRLGKRKHADTGFSRVDFYKPDQEEDEKGAITFGLALAISKTTTDLDASCAAYASAIGVILPDFVDNLKEVMRQHSIKTVDVFIPSQAAASKSIQNPPSWKRMVVLFGAGLLLLLKNLNAASFQKFLAARFKALKSVVRCIEDVPNPFTLKQAENITSVFGSDRKLKKRLVLFRFLAPEKEQNLLDISRFPTLTTLAAAVTNDKGGPVFNFSTPIEVKDLEIKRLLKIHKRSMLVPIKKSTRVHRFWMGNR